MLSTAASTWLAAGFAISAVCVVITFSVLAILRERAEPYQHPGTPIHYPVAETPPPVAVPPHEPDLPPAGWAAQSSPPLDANDREWPTPQMIDALAKQFAEDARASNVPLSPSEARMLAANSLANMLGDGEVPLG